MYFTDQYINYSMISFFKNFTKKKIGGLLLILVIIIAFGFGGFGGGFNTGNQNNIAKINNTNISTQDFMDYLNQSGLSQQVIKENIDKNIIEQLLGTLVSTLLLELEIKDLKLRISDDVLIKKIKQNKNFMNEKNKFKRTLYEKFLLTNNTTAPIFEERLKKKELEKQLFNYIGGGTKSPIFYVNKYYKEKNRKLDISYIGLDKFYKKIDTFTLQEINTFVEENSNKLKKDYIDFSYIIITPENLTGLNEYTQTFFDKIDDIENKISNNIDFIKIVNELNIKTQSSKNYINSENQETIENRIYSSRKDKIKILENNESFILYQIDEVNNRLPDINDQKFKTQIKKLLFQKEKYAFNKKIVDQINKNEFTQTSFKKLGNNKIKKIKLTSIEDNKKFEINSIKTLYSLPINSFTLIADNQENLFLAKIESYKDENITQNTDKFNAISNDTSVQNRNQILRSYDYLLNNKYDVVINEKTLDRVKNYFR